MLQAPAHILVSGEFLGIPGRFSLEGLNLFSHQTPQPDITEIHQFRILHITEIRRIGKNRIQGGLRQLRFSRIPALDVHHSMPLF